MFMITEAPAREGPPPIPPARSEPPPIPEESWWVQLGPIGRAGYVVSFVGLIVAICGFLAFVSTFDNLERDSGYGYLFVGARDSELPYQTYAILKTLRMCDKAIKIGLGIAFLGLLISLLNANKEAPPPSARIGAVSSVMAFLVALALFLYRISTYPL